MRSCKHIECGSLRAHSAEYRDCVAFLPPPPAMGARTVKTLELPRAQPAAVSAISEMRAGSIVARLARGFPRKVAMQTLECLGSPRISYDFAGCIRF